MTKHIHIDAVGGLAGDMFTAAMLDMHPDLLPCVQSDLAAAGITEHVELTTRYTKANGILAHYVSFVPISDNPRPTHHYQFIKERLQNSDLNKPVLERAITIFDLLAHAEATVHGVEIEKVHFHEVADWDSQADIVAAASLIENSGIQSWSCSALPMGGGTVTTEHGELPIPAPATAELLKGFTMIDDGVQGERITPTGAAILKHVINNGVHNTRPSGTLQSTGTGCGTKRFEALPNIVRLMLFDTSQTASDLLSCTPLKSNDQANDNLLADNVCLISYEVDDMTPEELAVGCENLRLCEGVLDVHHKTAIGKKGRSVFAIQVLCIPEHQQQTINACFEQTATIGLRCTVVQRYVLQRQETTANIDGKPVAMKTAHRPDGVQTTKIESDSLGQMQSLHERRSLARKAESAAHTMPGYNDD